MIGLLWCGCEGSRLFMHVWGLMVHAKWANTTSHPSNAFLQLGTQKMHPIDCWHICMGGGPSRVHAAVQHSCINVRSMP